MIKAEELKELIEKEATIYKQTCFKNKYVKMKLKKEMFINDKNELICKCDKCLKKHKEGKYFEDIDFLLENFFKTKSEAEFIAKYKNIRRTETLDLPTWKEAEIDKIIKISNNQNYCWYLIKSFTDKKNNEMFEFSLSKDDDQFYLSVNNEDSSYKDLFNKSLTCENYLEACEICRKLFLGEEV